MAEIHLGDVGTTLKIRFIEDDTGAVVDISGATTRQIILAPPRGARSVKTAAFTTDGTDGYIEYSTTSGDLNIAGKWVMQGFVSGPGFENHTSTISFECKPNLS